jgi:hypothetical protein
MSSEELLVFGGSTPGWLFRGTDSAWDVLAASLAEDPSQAASWPIAPSGPSMAPGDRVLLWRSGRGGGIAAACTVLDEPIATVGTDGRPVVTVDIRVDRAFEQPISPAELLTEDELRPLAFMDLFATMEHRISPAQAEALSVLIRGRDAAAGMAAASAAPSGPTALTPVDVPAGLVSVVTELLARLGAFEPAPPTPAARQGPSAPSPASGPVEADVATVEPTDLQVVQAEEAARAHGGEAFTVDEVAATWRTGVGTARSRIERLLESGLIERAGTRSVHQPGTSRPARGRPPVLYRLRSPDPLER